MLFRRFPHVALPLFLVAGCRRDVAGDSSADTAGADFSSNLPLVVMDTHGVDVDADELWEEDDTRAWADVSARFVDVGEDGLARLDDPPEYDGRGGLHVRGNSSAEEYDKKSYAFETWDDTGADQDVSLLGLPEEEDWVLQGPYSDKSLMRNELAYAWSRRLGRYAARTRFVELFVVDDGSEETTWDHYRGVYVFMEKLKRDDNRVALTELEPEDSEEPAISGGYLLRADWVEEDDETLVRTTACECRILLDDPEPDEITDQQHAWIQDWLDQMEAALPGGDRSGSDEDPADWIDVDTFVDYLLIQELARNVDAYVLSTWYAKDREGPLAMGPVWDFNGSMGNADYFEAGEVEGWHYENPEFPADNPWAFCWWEQLLEDSDFRVAVANRWRSIRESELSDDRITSDIQERQDQLAEAATRNFERWPVLGTYVWPNDEGCEDRTRYADEVEYLARWLLERAAWMDEALEGWES